MGASAVLHTTTQTGPHSEVGKLREVLVHRPDLNLQRLTPDDCKSLLFDDVLWVKKARQEHDVFVLNLERLLDCQLNGECVGRSITCSR